MVRTPCCDKTGLRKGTWTPEEDRKLKAYITRYGCWNWRQLPKYAGLSRCGKSCRLRWMNYLRPNLKRGNFSKEEEEIIINLHESLGNRWSAIAAQLPGRTDNEIKNHWHTYLKKPSKLSSSDHLSRKNKKIIKTDSSDQNLQSTDQQIFKSSPLSPQPSSSELSSFSTTDSAAAVNAENDVVPWELFAEPSESFWTEPFLADNFDSYPDDFLLAPLLGATGSVFPSSPVTNEGFLCSYYGLYDEDNNVFNWYNQLM